MKRRIYRNLPSSMSFSKEITVKFFVTPDGFIRDAIIQNSSENKDIDLTCLDAIYSSSPLPPPPPFRKVPPPPPAGLLLPPRYFGIGVYLFTFSKSDTPRSKSVPRFEYLVIPREVIYRYPKTFSLAELDSEQNKLLPKPFVNIEDARSQWAQFYKMHPTATKKEILDWSRLVDQFYLKTDTDNENWPPPFQPDCGF